VHPPQPEQESIFRSFCWVVKKCTPADKILATPMERMNLGFFRKTLKNLDFRLTFTAESVALQSN